ncbi:MAG: signal peptidase II [Alphaproteobacteria bacterium]|jgi:signal peptidase II|nr:signal peptidase II [Alphaproteobacteria bacterium]
MSGWSRFRLGIGLAFAVLVLDQASKWLILEVVMAPPRVVEVTGFLNFVLVWNRGISFGLFDGHAGPMRWVLIGVALGITAALIVWLRSVDRRFLAVVIGLIIGGAVGNVVDRLRFGAVVDFIDFHVFGYHWYTFNIADSAISVGVALLLIDSLVGPGSGRGSRPARGAGRDGGPADTG